MSGSSELSGPDLEAGIPAADLDDHAVLAGHAMGEPVLIARVDGVVRAIGAMCTHYGGPLGEGLRVGDTVRCPWHHACFDLRSGEALRAPALNDNSRWTVEERDGVIRVTHKEKDAGGIAASRQRVKRAPKDRPSAVVIIGAGAAGSACAEMLRREQYDGPVTLVDAEEASPYDRPNLSKDFLAGTAPEEWIPLHPPEFYREHDITIVRSTVVSLDANAREVRLSDRSTLSYGALLLAPGADPVRLELQLEKGARLLYLRSLADSRAIIAAAESSRRAVVLGASFIGLEVAASLRHRGLDVEVVAPEAIPLARVMGDELGGFVRRKHEANGVVFHLGTTAHAIDRSGVTLTDGRRIAADFVVAGVGVRPRVDLALAAGIPVDNGVPVDAYLRSSAPGIYAAGDIARFPDPRTGENIRVEHWVVAQRQGQAAARNILGAARPFDDMPFFWSHHYDAVIAYVGHASKWNRIALDGDPDALDCSATFWRDNQRLAVATIFRDHESLIAELELERSLDV